MDVFFQVPHDLKTSKEVNFDEICRLCRTSRGVMTYIFSCSGVDTSVPLSERIMDFANVKMVEGDGLPSLICHQCLYHIEKAVEFKKLCEQSDVFLREYLIPQVGTNGQIENENKVDMRSFMLNRSFHLSSFRSETNRHMKKEPIDNYLSGTADGSDELQCECDDGELNCPTCNKRFENTDQLSRHVLIHTQEGPFPCDFCEVVKKDKASLRSHWKSHAGQISHVCQTCGEYFSSKSLLLEHNLCHDKTKPHHCPVCQKAFTYRSDLRKHIIIHSGLRPYHCPTCFKSFTRSTNLNKHKRLHSGRKPFACLNCDKVFSARGDLVRHAVIHTGEKPFACSICSVSFNRKDKLTRHEKLHLGDRAYPCPECPSSFARKEELTKHVQFVHYSSDMIGNVTEGSEEYEETEDVVISVDPAHWTGEQTLEAVKKKRGRKPKQRPIVVPEPMSYDDPDRIYGCEFCFKRFRQRRELVRHTAIHTGYKPHTCSICDKAFARSDKLKRHMLIHERNKERESQREKEKQCSICSKVLSSKNELKRHIMTHSSLKPYQCSLCHCSYCRRDKLIKHIKRSHPNTLNTNGLVQEKT